MKSSQQISKPNNINNKGFRSPRMRPTSPEFKANLAPTMGYLSSPKFERLHDLNKLNSIGFYIEKDNKRQKMRKQQNKFSNLIDNYYNSDIHKRSWWPNGGLIIKRRYKYTGIGLDHFYEKNNVEQLETVEDSKPKIKKDADYMVKFPEFENLKYNEYMITIEHCASCEEHQYITQHQSNTIFKELALSYEKIIRERFPFIKVYLKPIDVEIVKNKTFVIPKVPENGGAHPPIPRLNTKFKQCRIGAFEIQIATKNEKGEVEQRIIHSKLKTKRFPDVNTVLKKIVSFMPRFRLKLILFDKEDYDEIEKMDNIQVNLYLCNSKMIKEVKDAAKLQVLNFTSPSRRLLMLKEQKFQLQQQNFIKNRNIFRNRKNIMPLSSQRITSALYKKKRGMTENNSTKSLRPISSMSYNFNEKFYETNKTLRKNGFFINSTNSKEKEIQTDKLSFSSLEISRRFGKDTNNQEMLKSQRGVLIKRKYSKVDEMLKMMNQNNKDDKSDEDAETSESVTLYFDDIPYDTYIIETIENSNFQGSLTLLKFNEIKPIKNNLITKYIGLWHQENAILNVHLYTEKERIIPKENNGIDINYNNNIIIPNDSNNQNQNQEKKIIRPPSSNQRRKSQEVNSIRIEQEPISTGNINISNAEDPNSRYKVYPNGKGIYEYKTTPGEYKLEVTNDDYEKIVMKVLLKSGLNTINIKMKQEKCCNLKIQVLEYNEYSDENYYLINNQNANEDKEQNEENEEKEDEEEKNNDINNRDNIYIEPVRNAEIQIFKDGNEILVEGITNKKGIMKYLVDKNENNLLIKVSKTGYYRVERVFKRNENLKENDQGNYECTMTFILVKIERLVDLNKILFISYSNTLKKIFELDVQNVDEERNKWQEKDMQEINGVFIASFNYELPNKENGENASEDTEGRNKALIENNNISSNKNNIINHNVSRKSVEDINDFNENVYYEEIVRFGLKISLDVIKDEYNQSYDVIRQNDTDLIEYLRSICSDGNIYTPNYDFHINLPKSLSKKKITPKYNEDKDNNDENINSDVNNNINEKEKEEFTGLYWDLGWIDVKNNLFYETSVYFKLEYKPDRMTFFENFIDFLQIFIDKRICDSIFNFFNYEYSVLAGSDRYLPKKNFESKLLYILDEDNRNKINENGKNISKSLTNKLNLKQIQMKKFVQFICNILCGYDEENNIKDDSISFYLLRKKISSNLQNFLNYSSNGKKETIKNEEEQNNEEGEEEE